MKLLIFAALITLASCSKPPDQFDDGERCYFACLISDKYTGDSVFVVRDTVWIDPCLTEYWWNKTREASIAQDTLFRHCNPFYRNGKLIEKERMFYVLDRYKNVPPKIY